MKTRLSVNVNKVALVRNTRHLGIPSVTRAASQCLQAGAHGITVHPRPDERHIRAQDVFDIATLMQDWPVQVRLAFHPYPHPIPALFNVRGFGPPFSVT